MIIFEWSGLGWLSPLIALLSVFAGLAAAGNGHG